MHRTFVLTAIATCAWVTTTSCAATIPAGTTLVVRTLNTIYSTDRVGKTFDGQLDQDIMANGKVTLPKGTKVSGKVEASQANRFNSQPLTLNITALLITGHSVPVKTTSGFTIKNIAKGGRARARGISVGPYLVPVGEKLQFKLAQAVTF